MGNSQKKIDQFPDISMGEITARYDTRDKVYRIFIDKSLLPDAWHCNELAFFDHAKKIIHFSCQGPGLSADQAQTVIKICEKIQETLNQ